MVFKLIISTLIIYVMFIGIKTFLAWIRRYFEYVQVPSDNLEILAILEVQETLFEIRKRKSYSEVDARRPMVGYGLVGEAADVYNVKLGKYDVPIPASFEAFIEFTECNTFRSDYSTRFTRDYNFVQGSSQATCRGLFLDQRPVTIKNVGPDHHQLDRELNIALQLNHEHILTYLFGFRHLKHDGIFVATEEYHGTLLDCLQAKKILNFTVADVLKEVGAGLKFMHDLEISHRNLNMKSIAVVARGKTLIYKINNFRYALEDADEKDLKSDVEDFGYLLDKVVEKFSDCDNFRLLSTADEVSRVDLIDKMTKEFYWQRPYMADVLAHPFLWTPQETLNFIVKIAKLLESTDRAAVAETLEKFSSQIFTSDWRGYIDKQLREELRAINHDKLPLRSIIGLIKTIRNLVSTISFLIVFLTLEQLFTSSTFISQQN